MKTWSSALRDGAVSGSLASIISTATLAGCSEIENRTPYAPTNATSHWLWGKRAFRQDRPSAHYTLLGYATHHASAILWATIYEKLFGDHADRGEVEAAVVGGEAVAALACFVDYQLTPKRLQPGYEARLSKPSLGLVYGVLGLSFALRGLLQRRR
jgi:ribosome modulation factor